MPYFESSSPIEVGKFIPLYPSMLVYRTRWVLGAINILFTHRIWERIAGLPIDVGIRNSMGMAIFLDIARQWKYFVRRQCI
jgi:hypothetical protein